MAGLKDAEIVENENKEITFNPNWPFERVDEAMRQ